MSTLGFCPRRLALDARSPAGGELTLAVGDSLLVQAAGLAPGGAADLRLRDASGAVVAEARVRVHDHGDIVMVLGCRPDHCRAADVDILDAILEARAFRDGRFKWIETDHEQIYRRDAMRAHRIGMILVVADREQAAMHLWMQRLDPAIHHFRESSHLRHINDIQARIHKRFRGAAG